MQVDVCDRLLNEMCMVRVFFVLRFLCLISFAVGYMDTTYQYPQDLDYFTPHDISYNHIRVKHNRDVETERVWFFVKQLKIKCGIEVRMESTRRCDNKLTVSAMLRDPVN